MHLTCFTQLLPQLLHLLPPLPLAACGVSQTLILLRCHCAQLVQLPLQLDLLHLAAGKLCSGHSARAEHNME
jgi:hypothetical protein